MILLPSIFHGILGMTAISIIAFSLFVMPSVFADSSETWTVSIMNGASQEESENVFYPNEIPVNDGDFVEWVNHDTVAHSITSGLPDFPDHYGHFFDVGLVQPGEKISSEIKITDGFEAFYYLCEIHPWMTGKIFVSGTPTSMPETINPIQLDKSSYQNNEKIQVTGQVHQDFWGTDYQILVYNEKNELVDMSIGDFDEESKFSQSIDTINFETSGEYTMKLIYALPSKAAEAQFDFTKILSNSGEDIPSWIKDIGEFWCTDQIDDEEFLNAIQYLIKKGVIVVNADDALGPSSQQIPEWVKNNTCWWSDDKITDIDFLSGIEFLVNKGTIRV